MRFSTRTIARHAAFFMLSTCCLFTTTGCEKEPMAGKKAISVVVEGIEDAVTKAPAFTEQSFRELGEFVMDIWVDDDYYAEDNTLITEHHYVSSSGSANVSFGSGSWSLSPSANWVDDDIMTFWCYAPASTNGTMNVSDPTGTPKRNMSFTYTLPNGGVTSGGNHIDADNQDDIMFSYKAVVHTINTGSYTSTQKSEFSTNNVSLQTTDEVPLTFHHALSMVNFCVSPDDGTFDKTVSIKSISISGVSNTGTCTANGPKVLEKQPDTDNTSGTKNIFTWSSLGTSGTAAQRTYTQTYNASFNSCPAGWTADTFGSSHNTRYTCNNAFFMIPQNITSAAKLTIVFEADGADIEVVKDLTGGGAAYDWIPDRYYTYKIGATTLGRTIKATVTLVDWENYDDKLFL